jgi:hypothetical protein
VRDRATGFGNARDNKPGDWLEKVIVHLSVDPDTGELRTNEGTVGPGMVELA